MDNFECTTVENGYVIYRNDNPMTAWEVIELLNVQAEKLEEAKLIITEVVSLDTRQRRLLEIISGARSIDEL